MKYVEEYKKSKSIRKTFDELMRSNYPKLKDNTIKRRWFDLKRKYGIIVEEAPKVKLYYENEYKITSNKNAFFNLMKQQHPHLKESSLKKYYSKLKKNLGEQEPIKPFNTDNKILDDIPKYKPKPEPKYLDEDKQELRPLKRLTWDDIVKYGYDKKYDRRQLMKYGFTTQEINWLIDNGEYKEENKYASKVFKKEIEDDSEETFV